jgi:hypothetical protein
MIQRLQALTSYVGFDGNGPWVSFTAMETPETCGDLGGGTLEDSRSDRSGFTGMGRSSRPPTARDKKVETEYPPVIEFGKHACANATIRYFAIIRSVSLITWGRSNTIEVSKNSES